MVNGSTSPGATAMARRKNTSRPAGGSKATDNAKTKKVTAKANPKAKATGVKPVKARSSSKRTSARTSLRRSTRGASGTASRRANAVGGSSDAAKSKTTEAQSKRAARTSAPRVLTASVAVVDNGSAQSSAGPAPIAVVAAAVTAKVKGPNSQRVVAKRVQPSKRKGAEQAHARVADTSHKRARNNVVVQAHATIRSSWLKNFHLLESFAKEHGHAQVAQRLDTEAYPKLGNWVANQRRSYRLEKLRAEGKAAKGGGRINAEQIRMLEAVPGFAWVGCRKTSYKGPSAKVRDGSPPKVILPAWRRNFAALQRFAAEFGHARVPVSMDSKEYPKLGNWVHVQRRAYRLEHLRKAGLPWKGNNRINPEQIELLESVGFEWAPTSRCVFVFQCERDCGFTGTFKAVKEHEAQCQATPRTSTAQEAESDADNTQKVFQCEHDCGFEGSFEVVERHERVCPSRPANDTSSPRKTVG